MGCMSYRTRPDTYNKIIPDFLRQLREIRPYEGHGNTAAIYLRKPTGNDGKSVAAQERQLRTKVGQLGITVAAVYLNNYDEAVA